MPKLKKLFLDNFFPVLLAGAVLSFFYPAILQKRIPIPADTIVGMYHPWRDVIWDGFSTGVPYKNFLITDPVRQQYVWRSLAVNELKKGQLPLWNPYSFSGTPLLANFQSASFYPLNILFFILPFNLAWTILVILQPLLSGIFLFLYLREIRISKAAGFLGGLTFAFCGFSVAWMEWNTIGHVILWVPLILLSVEKIITYYSSSDPERSEGKSRSYISNSSRQARTIKIILWFLVFIISLASSFFAGHLQVFFYSFLVITSYIVIRVLTLKKNKLKAALFFVLCFLFFVVITSIQWLPTLQFIASSARDFDQGNWMKEGWFIPWQNLMQFLSPDFFGNPSTGNYWGVWNYAEFVGYIGITPLMFVLYALIFRRDKKTLFFGSFVFLSLIFALPTPLAKLPYEFKVPLISTSQPTRLMFILDFSLSILAALGLDLIIRNLKNHSSIKKLAGIILIFSLVFSFLWLVVLNPSWIPSVSLENILIAKRNLIFPTAVIVAVSIFVLGLFLSGKNKYYTTILCSIVVLTTAVDLFRFGWKFTPFSKSEWIFPETKIINFLKQEPDQYRIMAIDRRIMPPNFAMMYKLADVAGYDPLYLRDYGQLVASWDRDGPDISPASFNRIITPVNYESFIADLLGVKYILSLNSLKSPKLNLINQEGDTYLYRNNKVFPRAFLVENVIKAQSLQETIDIMFKLKENLRTSAVTTENIKVYPAPLERSEQAIITGYFPNSITIQVNTVVDRLLVLSDIYYPLWHAFIDGKSTKVYKVDFALRGVLVPAGKHTISFSTDLL